MIPWALAGTSVPYNLPGVNGRVRLSGPVIANIYLGSITQWDDPAIKALNPSLTLPGTEDHAGLPLGRLGHVVQLHRVPVVGQRVSGRARSASTRQ